MVSPLSPDTPTRAGDRRFWGALNGASQALAIAKAASDHKGLTLVVTHDTSAALRLEEEIRFFSPTLTVLHFPDWEILSYDVFSPHQDIISQRIATLSQLHDLRQGVLILPVSTLLQRLPPASFYQGQTFALDIGQTFDVANTRRQLENAGYHCVDTVYEHGEFAVRGAIMDIFPMGHEQPFRIELFDDEIESLRTFDPDSQRTLEKTDQVRILPAREFPMDTGAIRTFKTRWFDFFDNDPKSCPVFTDVAQGIAPAGIEYFLPLFFTDDLGHLFDHLPDNTLIIHDAGIESAAQHFRDDVESRYESRRYDIQRPIMAPAHLFLATDELFSQLNQYPRAQWHAAGLPDRAGATEYTTQALPDLSVDARAEAPLAKVQRWLEGKPGRIVFVVESAGRREALKEMLGRIRITPKEFGDWPSTLDDDSPISMVIGPLEQGVSIVDEQSHALHLVTENELFGQRIRQTRRRQKQKTDSDMVIRDLSELKEGAPVVHLDHGVGRYLGLQTLDAGGQVNEFVVLEYASNDKLYVPVASLHLISRYGGAEQERAPVNKLGTDKWSAAKRKAAEKIRDTAAELLDIYARRQARKGFAFDEPDNDYQRFAAGFPYEETPDQQSAIEAVIGDMCSPRPMDRLVCGDVGFGKTEVAMRAAFMAVQSGKQVAVLVPTTLLAQQHYQNFADRFAEWPVKVDVLSRFKSAKDTQAALDRMLEGKTDIVVGTHKLLQKDVQFDHLGLLIIDEEHRFGVAQKEKIKALRAEVDILTLTATPIPRTLNMAMASIRDLSIIATPPAKRLSVKTFVRPSDDATVKEAVLREILRGGQVYFLHNEVKTIERVARELGEAIPEARIGVAHGQMSERELESVMSDFYHKRFNMLVCTTIIETGIDIPSANTIIIERADKFGLAQLHQLRGRVGRSHHQAYAYLLTPPKKLTKDAEKRLEAISAAQDLGAGFMLATHDLEIRGAGELLGDEQSGQIETIGFTLYMEMLEQAVNAIRSGKEPSVDLASTHGADVNLHLPARIPDDYLPDVNSRLTLYKRIASAKDDIALKELQVEMIDRFGLLPDPVKHLFNVTSLKLKLQPLGIARLDANDNTGRIEFARDTEINPFTLIKLVQTRPDAYKLDDGNSLRFYANMDTIDRRFQTIDQLLVDLQKDPNA